MKTVLFLCTGNYYRSRFAEELFNHQAERADLDWIAQSRGLALERGALLAVRSGGNVGPGTPLDGKGSDPVCVISTIGQQHDLRRDKKLKASRLS